MFDLVTCCLMQYSITLYNCIYTSKIYYTVLYIFYKFPYLFFTNHLKLKVAYSDFQTVSHHLRLNQHDSNRQKDKSNRKPLVFCEGKNNRLITSANFLEGLEGSIDFNTICSRLLESKETQYYGATAFKCL